MIRQAPSNPRKRSSWISSGEGQAAFECVRPSDTQSSSIFSASRIDQRDVDLRGDVLDSLLHRHRGEDQHVRTVVPDRGLRLSEERGQ